MVLLFARSGLYGDRASRPGLRAVVSSLFAVTIVALLYAKVDGQDFQSYYIFWGSLIFSILIVGGLRFAYDAISGRILRAAGYHRRAVLVGTGQHIDAVAHALNGGPVPSPIEVVGFISLSPRPDNGMRSLGALDDLPAVIERDAIDEVIIADPAFPQQQAVELVDACHRRGVRVRVAPSTMEILVHRAEFVPGRGGPAVRAALAGVRGRSTALVKRTFDVIGSLLLLLILSPLLLAIAIGVRITSRGPVLYRSRRPGIGGTQFDCLKFRTMYADAHERQAELEQHNEADGPLFKIRDGPARDPGRPDAAALLARRAAAAVERRARRDVARRPAPAAPARLRSARGLASQALSRAAGDHRALAGLGPFGARLRRSRAPRLPLPRALVGLTRPLDPREDDPRGAPGPRRVLSRPRVEDWREAVWAAMPEGAEPERLSERRAFLLAHVAPGTRLLDLGCGDGAFAAAALGAGAQVTGADVAREALRRARERAPQATLVAVAEGARLPFAEDAFDVVWCGETLEHVADVTGLLAEVRRVLRWGGTLLVTTPNLPRLGVALEALRGAPLEARLDPRADHLRFFTAGTLRELLTAAGFADVRVAAVGGPPWARAALQAVAR